MTYLEYLGSPEGAALARLRWNIRPSEWRTAATNDAPIPFTELAERHGWPGLKPVLQALTCEPTAPGERFTCAECGREFGIDEAFDPETRRFCWWS